MANQIVWVDIPVRDLERAIKFYTAVLGEPVTREPFPGMTIGLLPHAQDAVSGCLYLAEDNQPSTHGPMIYLNCKGRLDQAVGLVASNGGKVLKPKHQIGPYGFRAIVEDSEGNRIALHSN